MEATMTRSTDFQKWFENRATHDEFDAAADRAKSDHRYPGASEDVKVALLVSEIARVAFRAGRRTRGSYVTVWLMLALANAFACVILSLLDAMTMKRMLIEIFDTSFMVALVLVVHYLINREEAKQ
jgi:hypothetical protein